MFFEVISWKYVGICYAVFLQQFWISFIVWETCFSPVFIEKKVENMQIFSRSWCPFDIKLRQPQQNWVHWKGNFMTFQKTGYNGTGITRLFSVHKVFFLEVISWIYVSICYASIFASVWNKFNCWETCFCPIFVEKCEKNANFPTVMTSYWYRITPTSAKFASLERKFYDLSENIYMSIVSEKILLGFEVFCETPIFS